VASVQMEAARIPDRDRMMEILREHGFDPRPVDEVGIEVPCDDAAHTSDEVFGYVEGLVIELGDPFVPIKHEGVVYLRPPIS
jgi:hypothetical protein